MNRTRMLGTASSLIASNGANAGALVRGRRGVRQGRQKAARTSEATPETMKVLVSAASIAGPVLSVESAVPSQATNPPAWAIDGTFAQSIGMKMNGQLAAIQPIVPQSRIESELLLGVLQVGERDRVGHRERRHVEEAVEQHQPEERPERLLIGQRQHRQAADQVAERQELLLREVAVGELAAEEHAGQRRDREGVEDPGLLDPVNFR